MGPRFRRFGSRSVELVTSCDPSQCLIAATFVVILARIATVILGDYVANGDIAVIELRVRDVFSPGVQLGAFSRFGWSHPGPLLYWVFAPFYELFGERSVALQVVAGLIAIGSVVGIASTVKKVLGSALVVAVIPLVLLVASLGGEFWVSPWNPDVPLLPFAWLVALLWALASGTRQPLWLIVFLASFIVQAHVGFVLPVFTMLIAGVGFQLLVRDPSDSKQRFSRTDFLLAFTVGLIAWLPPLVEHFREGSEGNISKMFEFFTGRHNPRGTAFGLRMMSNEFGIAGSWWRGIGESHAFTGDVVRAHTYAAPVVLIGLVGVAVVAIREGDRVVQAGVALASSLTFAAVIAVGSIEGYLYNYLVRWVAVVGWWTVTIIVVGAARWIDRNFELREIEGIPRNIQRLSKSVAALVVCAVVLGPAVVRGISNPVNADTFDRFVPRIAESLIEYDGSVLPRVIIGQGSLEAELVSKGLLLELEKRGMNVFAIPDEGYIVGDHRTYADGDGYELVINVATDTASIHPAEGAEVVVRLDELKPAERVKCDVWTALVTQLLVGGKSVDEATLGQKPKCGKLIIVSRRDPVH